MKRKARVLLILFISLSMIVIPQELSWIANYSADNVVSAIDESSLPQSPVPYDETIEEEAVKIDPSVYEEPEPIAFEEKGYNADTITEDAEALQAYRDSVDYVENKIVFSVLDYREKGAKAEYLTNTSEICRKYKLKNVELVIDVKTDKVEKKAGLTAYQVFYSATVKTDDIWAVVDEMAKEDGVMSAEPDFIWESAAEDDMQEVTPEELEFSNWSDHGINVGEVWGSLTEGSAPGEGVVVAVVDTGVDYNHNDLKDSMWTNPGEIADNGVDDDGNGYIDDIHGINLIDPNRQGNPMDDMGHGTHVAGIIAMSPGNGGGVGIAYGAKIMAVKAGQSNGSLASTDIAKGIQYASANGADVINMSFGGQGRSSLVEAALGDAFGTCVLVASAGNDGLPTLDSPFPEGSKEDIFPAGYSYVLGVMASDHSSDLLAGFSNWDYLIGRNCEYELAAPGVAVMSTLPNNRYAKWSGTSMAAPVVSAAAAIIRREHPNKTYYSSRYIMGQLASATNDVAYKLYSNTFWGPYGLLNISDSLSEAPKPNLSIRDIIVFDSDNISSSNNGDGVIQSGETLDIGFDLFNRWGIAKDVSVSVDATSAGEVDNPYVEFITDEISLTNEVGTFAGTNNGFVYNDDMLVGVENPIRLKISDDAPNELSISLNIHISCKNGLDDNEEPYVKNYSYSFTVQKGAYLRGVISEDMTLTNDKLWIVDRSVLIPEGVTVNVEPGTHLQFYSVETGPYAEIHLTNILVKGTLNFNGTYQDPIQIYPAKSFEDYLVDIRRSYEGGNFTGDINMEYVKMYNPYLVASNCSHVLLEQTTQGSLYDIRYEGGQLLNVTSWGITTAVEVDHLEKSIITRFHSMDTAPTMFPTLGREMDTVLFNRNALYYDNTWIHNKETMSQASTSEMEGLYSANNVFLNNYNIVESEGYYYVAPSRYELYNPFVNNAILNSEKFSEWFKVYVGKNNHDDFDISNNYWGTSNSELISKMVVDVEDDASLQKATYAPFLTLEDDLSSIYPFVTEAYITDESGENRLDTVSGSQTVQVHVKFNRDMAQEDELEPMISFGPAEPYTDYVVQGDWANAREWVGSIKIDPFINQGIEYIRIKDAAAEDDHWLRTGTDTARFSFEINKNSAEALTLQGNGGSNCNYLNWVQDDFDTLAGYNLYRATSYDPAVAIEEQSFEKINSSIIANDEYEYTDYDVEQGVDYYYYFTVVDTDFNESKPSNVVMCTPLDEESPVITTRAIPTQTVGRQVTVAADITDNVEVTGASLFYRMQGTDSWTEVQMRNTTGNTYQAVISAYDVNEGTMQYYIAAQDGTNTSYAGTAEVPNVFAVEGIVYAQAVTLNQTATAITVGDTAALTATIFPENVTDNAVSWTSSDESIATVDENGNVSAVGIGSAVITATSVDGKASAICNITVNPVQATELTIDPAEKEITIGETFNITAAIAPENITDASLDWESSNTAIASVDENGKVTGVGVGTATITATTKDGSGLSKICTVTVKPIAVKAVSLTPISLSLGIGDEANLTARVFPDNATNKNVEWTSSNSSVASVDNGKVTALKGGNAVITVTTEDGGFSAICNVNVTLIPTTDITLNKDELTLNTGDSETLTVTNAPANASSTTYVWKSDNKNVAKVSNGTVTAVSPGMAYISCTTTDGSDITKVCKVEVYEKQPKPAAPVVVSKSLTTVTLKKIEGALYSCGGEEWVESNKFTGLDENTEYSFYIKMAQNGYYLESDPSDATKVRTDESVAAVTGVEISPEFADLIIGDKLQMTIETVPAGSTDAVEWSSTNPAVATVDESGLVTAEAIGHTYIVCKSADNNEIMSVSTVKVYDLTDTPDMPEVVGTTEDTITLTSVQGLEYKLEDEEWSDEPVISGLKANTEYRVYARIAANGYHMASEPAEAVICTSDHDWADEITVDVEPTFDTVGSGSIHCKVCGAIKEGTTVEVPVKEKPDEWQQALEDKDAAIAAKNAALESLAAAQADLATAQANIAALNETIESKDATIAEKEAALTEANTALATANANLTQATQDLAAANEQLAAASNTISELQGMIAGKEEELTQAQTELAAAQTQLIATQAELETATENYNSTKAELDAANETIASLNAQLTDKEAALQQALADKAAAIEAKNAAQESLATAQADLATAQNTIETLNQTIESKDATIAEKEAALAKANEDLAAANTALTKAQEDLAAANEQLAIANDRIANLEAALDGNNDDLVQALEDLSAAQRELTATQAALETATANYNSTKADLDAANETIESLNTQLADKEAALQQALADKAAAIEAKNAAQESLATAQADLATAQANIAALNETIESKDATIAEKEAALAKAQEDLAAANTALTKAQEDLAAANEQLAIANDRIANLETALDGNNDDLVQALEDLSAAQRELESTQAALETATANYNTTKTQLDAANETIESLNAQLTDKEAELQQALADKAAAIEAKTAAQESLATAQADLATAQNTIVTLNETIESKDATIAEKEAALTEANTALATANANLTKANNDLAAANEQLAIATDRIANLEAALDGNNDDLVQALEDLSAAQRELESTQAALETATANYNSTKTQLDAANETIASLNAQLTDKEAALQQALADKAAAIEAKNAAQESLATAQADLATAQANIAALNETIESKDATIAEKEAALAEANTALATANANLTQATQDLAAANEQLALATARIEDLEAALDGNEDLAKALEDLNAARSELAATQTALETATANYNSTKTQLDAAVLEITDLRDQLETAIEDKEKAEADLAAANEAKEAAVAAANAANQRVEELTQAKAELEEQLANASEASEEVQAELDRVNAELTAAEKEKADAVKAKEEAEAEVERLKALISASDISKATISGLSDKTYTGSAITPAIKVSLDGKNLVERTDYSVYYVDNIEVGTATVIVTGEGDYNGVCKAEFVINKADISNAVIAGASDAAYKGTAITPAIAVSLDSRILANNNDYTVSYSNNVEVGTATVTVTGKGNYEGTCTASFKINKANNTLAASAKKVKVKASKLKKKKQNIAAAKAFVVSGAQGPVTYRKISGKSKITVSAAGKVTVKKGLKKGTYKVQVQVTAAGNTNYNAGSQVVTLTIKVK